MNRGQLPIKQLPDTTARGMCVHPLQVTTHLTIHVVVTTILGQPSAIVLAYMYMYVCACTCVCTIVFISIGIKQVFNSQQLLPIELIALSLGEGGGGNKADIIFISDNCSLLVVIQHFMMLINIMILCINSILSMLRNIISGPS